MNDREVKIRELLERRADGFPSYHRVPPKLIARARRSMVTTALAVCLIGSGLGYGAFAGVRAIGRAVVPASPTPSTKPVPSPSETAAASPSPSPIEVKGLELVFPLDGSVSEVKVGDGGLYAAYTPTRDGDHQLIARLDLRTGAVKESAPLPPGVSLALAGGSLLVTYWKGSNSEVRVLARLDPHTLAVRATVPIPGWSSELAPAPAGLWVGSGTGGYLLDPTDGRVLRSVKLDGQAGAMSVDPSGRLLYVVTSVPGAADPTFPLRARCCHGRRPGEGRPDWSRGERDLGYRRWRVGVRGHRDARPGGVPSGERPSRGSSIRAPAERPGDQRHPGRCRRWHPVGHRQYGRGSRMCRPRNGPA